MFRARFNATHEISQAIESAVSKSVIAMHIEQCNRDKAELKAEQYRMHTENIARHDVAQAKNDERFSRIEEQNARIMRYISYAAGAVMAFHLIFSAEGLNILSKIPH